MSLDSLVKDKKVIAVVCNQWGDTGKGKFSDYFAAHWADVIARGTGGNNAGHTVVINGEKRVFHLIPAGIVYDKDGKVNILGNGMVIDLDVLCSELDDLKKANIPFNNLMISEDAHVIMPYHIAKDKAKNGLENKGIGSTGRGIGPCYEDKIARRGIMIRDIFDCDKLRRKIMKNQEMYKFTDSEADDFISHLAFRAVNISPFVRNTVAKLQRFMSEGKKVLLEGAQGLLLSIEYGTYPYVTSSDCSVNGTAAGVGISARAVDLCLGVVKFPYMTRVGNGPFPTECGGEHSEEYCAAGMEHDVKYELSKYNIPFTTGEIGSVKYDSFHANIVTLLNSKDPFEQGIGLRLAGFEYGATTGRPRRTGWTDLVALKYAVGINGPDMILTKPDVVRGADEFKLCDRYYQDAIVLDFVRDPDALRNLRLHYKSFKGFTEDISEARSPDDLPKSLLKSIDYAEKVTGGRFRIISTGPDQAQTIIRD